jgi:4-hydroxybenzoyl-CoA thioesterase
MARVSVTFPDKFFFTTTLAVRIHEVNYGKHLGNDAVLSLMHEARVQFLKSLGLSEFDMGGTSIIMRDVVIVYRSEAHHGDELLVEIGVGEFTRSSFDIFYKLTNRSTGKPLADAKTGIVCYDYETAKVCPVPAGFKARFV